jgi:predicted nucleic acid-binding protein
VTVLYLDTSALAKLVTREVQSAVLQAYLAERSEVPWVTVGLTRTELLRAAYRTGAPQTVDDARTVLATLDAIHLAGAKMVGPGLEAVVTYDGRMYDAARAAGLPVARPGAPR